MNPDSHILLVEDDPEISAMVSEVLSESGFRTLTMNSAMGIENMLLKGNVSLVVLDILLPGEDGLSICRRLRACSRIPIIMLTALGDDVDRIVGLEMGADDYLPKPFNSRELVARVRAVLRRSSIDGMTDDRRRIYCFDGWKLNSVTRQIFNPAGLRVATTSAEFDLLLAFCQNPSRILSRDKLLQLTRNGLAGPIERSIDVHVSRIRQKVEHDPRDPTLIKTVRLGGYIFTPRVELV